jgi:putative thioredoxin
MKALNFEETVINRSHEIPVLVDFWAEWCGPCRALGPILEQTAREQRGQWDLVKVDTEAESELAEAFEIRSIPAVKLFYRGEVIAEFLGAKTKPQLDKWLQENLPDASREELSDIIERLQVGDPSALQDLELFFKANPHNENARLTLAQEMVFRKPAYARELVAVFGTGHAVPDAVSDIRTICDWMEQELSEDPVAQTLNFARMMARKMELEVAIQKVIEAVNLDKSYQQELPRRLGVALFRTWGNKDVLSQRYRRLFDMALY